jgi:hypothetical protein
MHMDDIALDNLLFRDAHPTKGKQWCCIWSDHAERRIRRWLGPASMSQAKAKRLASEEYMKYTLAHAERLQRKHELSEDELAEIRQRCTFPRVVVAFHILRICRRIAQVDALDEDRKRSRKKGTPGLQLFAERTGISTREVHRLIEDYERVAVGYDTVDKICAEFHMLFDDFIEEARQWAAKEGMWERRTGSEDSWPIGYEVVVKEPEYDPLMDLAVDGSDII